MGVELRDHRRPPPGLARVQADVQRTVDAGEVRLSESSPSATRFRRAGRGRVEVITFKPLPKNPGALHDVSVIFRPDADLIELMEQYAERNPSTDRKAIGKVLQNLTKIINNHVGLIELAEDLDIETVSEIFIRVNSADAELSQADFAMSKIAVNDSYGGNLLRKAIDYFCHLAVSPEFYARIEKGDKAFAQSEFFGKMRWLKDVNEDLYDPTCTDMLRVAFTSELGRGRLDVLVALLSGRNFETRQYEEVIAEESFARLKTGILAFINKTHFECLVMILRSAGFVTSGLIRSRNAVNFAYILYLRGRKLGLPADDIERLVRRWYAMSIVTGRYAGSPESTFDVDIRQIDAQGLTEYANAVIDSELPSTFWTGLLPQSMDTSSSTSPYCVAYQAAQVHLGDKGFLSTDITVRDLLLNHGDKHHVFPRKYLQRHGVTRNRYCTASGFLDSGLTVFASTPPRPARGGRVAPGPGFGSRTSPASSARCTSA